MKRLTSSTCLVLAFSFYPQVLVQRLLSHPLELLLGLLFDLLCLPLCSLLVYLHRLWVWWLARLVCLLALTSLDQKWLETSVRFVGRTQKDEITICCFT